MLAAGRKLSDQEKFKRDEHPFDAYHRLQDQAAKNEFPKPADNFRWRYYGLFYVAPAQNSYMCRLRIPNGILKHWQLAGLADLAERYGGGYSHVTTRANFQIREIEPKNAISLLEAIVDLGLCSKGTGADNIRNVTGTPTAGIDPQELLDTRPYARAWHHHILNERALYGLPRKFNVAFDGAGAHRRAGGHQRHRLPGGRGEATASASSRASGSVSRSAASPATGISRATPAWCSSPPTRPRSRTPSCACSPRMATAPTATRRV